MLGAIAANLLPGDPVWLGLIGPPSSAKTNCSTPSSGLPHVIQAATVTPSGLLSGTPDKQKDKGARGGTAPPDRWLWRLRHHLPEGLRQRALHARRDPAETLAALREVYDGAWTRHLGSAGGKSCRGKAR